MRRFVHLSEPLVSGESEVAGGEEVSTLRRTHRAPGRALGILGTPSAWAYNLWPMRNLGARWIPPSRPSDLSDLDAAGNGGFFAPVYSSTIDPVGCCVPAIARSR